MLWISRRQVGPQQRREWAHGQVVQIWINSMVVYKLVDVIWETLPFFQCLDFLICNRNFRCRVIKIVWSLAGESIGIVFDWVTTVLRHHGSIQWYFCSLWSILLQLIQLPSSATTPNVRPIGYNGINHSLVMHPRIIHRLVHFPFVPSKGVVLFDLHQLWV